MVVPALAGMMNADEGPQVRGRQGVSRLPAFDGTRVPAGCSTISAPPDPSNSAARVRCAMCVLPGNTLQIRGQAVCASIKGLPFEPCFNLDKRDDRTSADRYRAWASPIAISVTRVRSRC
jgi:hypothetical protein